MKGDNSCITPEDSDIVKEGELLKIGKKTGTMQKRFYILRDHSLFIYNNKGQKIPSSLIFLKGTFILHVTDKNKEFFGFSIYHPANLVHTRTYYHRSKDVIDDWIRLLRFQATGNYSLTFDEKYVKGPKLGQGKFSSVFQCRNRETNEAIAVKQIVKSDLSEREQDFLREEI